MKTTFVLILAITFFSACSSDDESVAQISTPIVAYGNTALIATFFQEGNSTAPTINWNGDQGRFSLTSAINGLSIDSNTGILSWTKLLTPKTHTVEVIAKNSAGQITINITINTPFQGVFTGGINFDPSSTTLESFQEYTFNTDGSFVTSGGYTGAYTLSDTSITTDFFVESIGFVYDTLELSYTSTEVKLIGYWSTTNENPTQTNAHGYIQLTYVE